MDPKKFTLSDSVRKEVGGRSYSLSFYTDAFKQFLQWATDSFPYEFQIVRCDSETLGDGTVLLKVCKCQALHRGVVLGFVEAGYFRRRYSLRVRSHHPINDQTTADVGRAMAIFKKHFYGVDDARIMREAMSSLRREASHMSNLYAHALDRAKLSAGDAALQYLMDNLQVVAAQCPGNREVAALVKAVQDFEDNAFKSSLEDQFNKGKFCPVVECEDGTWLVGKPTTAQGYVLPEMRTFKSWDDMPEHIQTKVGFLRMLDKTDAIEGVGLRLNNATFAVFNEDESC